MDIDLSRLDLVTLKAMYNKQAQELKLKLLNGSEWHEVRDQRLLVTRLAMALHQRITPLEKFNPAEFPPMDGDDSPKPKGF